jgi:metal transporter CNNM
MDYLVWVGILVCIIHSAMFSGANLAFFSLGRMRLEAEVEKGNKSAKKILRLRNDANLLLCTILWGNVSANVLLSLLSTNVFAGVGGFLFSTVGITFFGEIIPQAYFSRHAMRVGAMLSPIMRFYQILLYPLAKSCAFVLDGWIGPEGPVFYRERDIEIILHKHIRETSSEISANEGQGALNFLDLDDREISSEGSAIDPSTIYQFASTSPSFPSSTPRKGRTSSQNSRAILTLGPLSKIPTQIPSSSLKRTLSLPTFT